LFCGTRAVLAFANVLDLLANELAGLSAWRLSFALILADTFECFLSGISSPQI